MKLRYYLRGLGIGIFVTALIMGVSGRKAAPLTDAEIKAKAAALGMIESDARKLTDVTPTAKPAEAAGSSAGTTGISAETAGGSAGEIDASAETTGSSAGEIDASAETTGSSAGEIDASVETAGSSAGTTDIPAETADSSEKNQSAIFITIKSGSGSGTVAGLLEEAGLVENAADFDRYLIDHGYSKRISVGSYEIAPGTSEEEIARIITKTQ